MQEGLGIYTVELYLKVRLAVSEGMSRRQAAKHFNISRDSVAKMVSYSTPPGYQRQLPIRRPKLDAFVSTIDHWLDEDVNVAWHLIVRMRMFGSRLAFNLRTSSSAVANQLQVWAIPSWPGRAAKLLKKRGIPNLYFRRSDCEIIKVHLDVVARCFSS
jgi:hypothetical protein